MAAASPRRRRDTGADRVHQLAGGAERPGGDDGAGDPPRESLLAVRGDDRREVLLGVGVEHLRDYAGLDRDVVVAGVFSRVEIWDGRRWQERDREGEHSLNESDELPDFGI